MRRIVWFGAAAAVLLLLVAAATIGWRVTAPDKSAPPATAALSPSPPPSAPATAPTAPSAPATPPSFDIVTVDPRGQAVIAGRAEPGDRVRILDGGQTLGEVTADARGEWVLVPSQPIAPGNRQLSLEATGPNGGPARRSDDLVALSVVRPAAPGSKPSAFAVLLPGGADQPARVLQEPDWASGVRRLLSVETASYGAARRLVLTGHALAGAKLKVYAGDQLLGMTTADAAGRWSLASPQPVPDGALELWVDQLDADGGIASRIGVPFQPPTGVALAQGGTYVVRQGNSLWVIARELFGNGERYTVIFSANRGLVQDPNLIFPGQQLKVPKS